MIVIVIVTLVYLKAQDHIVEGGVRSIKNCLCDIVITLTVIVGLEPGLDHLIVVLIVAVPLLQNLKVRVRARAKTRDDVGNGRNEKRRTKT